MNGFGSKSEWGFGRWDGGWRGGGCWVDLDVVGVDVPFTGVLCVAGTVTWVRRERAGNGRFTDSQKLSHFAKNCPDVNTRLAGVSGIR